MEFVLNSAVQGVQLSGIRRFTALVRNTPGACSLTIGEPDQNTPEVVKDAAKAALAGEWAALPGHLLWVSAWAAGDESEGLEELRETPLPFMLREGGVLSGCFNFGSCASACPIDQ